MSVKIEHEDPPVWEETNGGQIVPVKQDNLFVDTGLLYYKLKSEDATVWEDRRCGKIEPNIQENMAEDAEETDEVALRVTTHGECDELEEYRDQDDGDSCKIHLYEQTSQRKQSVASALQDLGKTPPSEDACECECGFQAITNEGMRSELDGSHKSNQCHIYKKSFTSMSGCKQHEMTLYKFEKPYRCQFCEESFISKSACKRHIRSHANETLYQFCEKTFITKQKRKIPLCRVCGKLFASRYKCRQHELTDHYQCQFCKKLFRGWTSWKQHEKIHTGEKPFKCQFCEKAFMGLSSWKQHERIHTGEKPFKCQFCEKAFISKQRCQDHEKSHTGERPFKCQFCERSFIRNSHRKRHEVDHKEENYILCTCGCVMLLSAKACKFCRKPTGC